MSKLSSYFSGKDAKWKFIIKLGLALVLFAPLVIYNDSYFPFVFPRNMFFRLIIDIIFPLYLWLVVKNTYQWPKFNKGLVFFVLFILVLTISSIFGGHFLLSFWSTFERMDGLANWYHILMYVIVLFGVNKNEKDWHFLFKTSLLAGVIVALYALGQALGWSFVMSSAGGQRLASTLGNAAYVGSYLFLNIVIASYLLIKKIQQKDFYSAGVIYYTLSIILFIAILLATETRGAFLALLVFILVMILAFLYYERHKRNTLYYIIVGLLIAGIIFVVSIFVQKNSDWVRSVPIFSRLANISLTDTSTQSRLMIWKNSVAYAFKEKPLLGWGEENFSDAFNKYFPSAIFVTMGSEIWFDRPHNILVQHLVQGGLLGFGFYVAIFIYLLIVLGRLIKKEKIWAVPVLWSAFLLGFLVQDFFIFDNLNVNVVFYLLLAYLFSLAVNQEDTKSRFVERFAVWQSKLYNKKINLNIRAVFLILLSIALVYFMVWKPWRSNTVFVKTFFYAPQAKTAEDFAKVKSDWLRAYYMVPLGDKEKIAALNDLLGLVIGNPYATDDIRFEFINLTGQYLESNYAKNPMDIRSGMFLSNFYQFVGTFDASFIDQDIALLEKMAKLAPWRLEVKFALQKDYQRKGDLQKAKEQVLLARDLAPNSRDVYWKLAEFYWIAQDYQEFELAVDKVRTWNRTRGIGNFDQAQTADLNNYLQQAKANKQKELVTMLESFLQP
ncbi:MAG: hypothetical protein QG642_416 [Patescibacteria group bacterium]|nr:hypothetical protein [Patescibacteria group bacterium]